MRPNRRQLITTGTVAAAVTAAGGSWWVLRDDDDPEGASDRIDLLAGAYAGSEHQTDPELFVMLSLTGGMPKNITIELRFFDLDGSAVDPPGELAITLANLITGEETRAFDVTNVAAAWQLQQSAIEANGWWQLRVESGDLAVSWTFLLPDPNLTGFDTPPEIETDPDAQAMLSTALDVLRSRASLRWWQWLGGGNGAIILTRYGITTPESNGLPPSFESDSLLAGRIPLDGTAPDFRADNARTVTVGDEAIRYSAGATPEVMNPVQYLPLDQYDTTYDGHDGVHFGITAEIDGRRCQLVAFRLPGQVEAQFAFWIEVETAIIREIFMISVNHYMHWVYFDIDEPFRLSF